MELKEIIYRLLEHKKTLFLTCIFGTVIGIGLYYSPTKKNAIGSFYVYRDAQMSEDGSFSYEGYYSQQVAISYAKTAIALLESPDIRRNILVAENKDVNERNLRKIKKSISATKAGPQLIQVKVTEDSSETALTRWNNLAGIIQGANIETNLLIIPISKDPVLVDSYKNLPVFLLGGCGLGLFAGVAIIAAVVYLREETHA